MEDPAQRVVEFVCRLGSTMDSRSTLRFPVTLFAFPATTTEESFEDSPDAFCFQRGHIQGVNPQRV